METSRTQWQKTLNNVTHSTRHTTKAVAVIISCVMLIVLTACDAATDNNSASTSESQPAHSAISQSNKSDSDRQVHNSDNQHSIQPKNNTPANTTPETKNAVAIPNANRENAQSNLATQILTTIPVKGRAPKTGYSREQFGPAWYDTDHNGCDTRDDILNRDLTNKTWKTWRQCKVKTGRLHDPYTGLIINYLRGVKTGGAVQIDHVVALSNAWQTGAQQLSNNQRLALANDPLNLLAVQGAANRIKSDSDAASWLPSNKAFRCEYVARQIAVKHKYGLWVTAPEHNAMQYVLQSCPNQVIPQ